MKKIKYILGVYLFGLLLIIPNILADNADSDVDKAVENMKKAGIKAVKLDNKRIKIGKSVAFISKPVELNLPIFAVQDIMKYRMFNPNGFFMSNNRFFYYENESEGIIDLQSGKIIKMINPYSSDFKIGRKRVGFRIYNSQFIIEFVQDSQNNFKYNDEMIFYDIDKTTSTSANGINQTVVVGEIKNVGDNCLKEFRDNFDEHTLSFDSSSSIKQGEYEIIMYNSNKNIVTRYDVLNNTCTASYGKDSDKIVNEFLLHNLAGKTGGSVLSYVHKKPPGHKYGYPGVYEWDEKGNEKKTFEYGNMVWLCPDEKTRIVAIGGEHGLQYMVVLYGHGEKALKIPYTSYRIDDVCALSGNKKILVISEDEQLVILKFKDSLY